MKFKISVSDLQYAMRLVRDIVPSSASFAESAGVLMDASGDVVVFTAFNSEVIARAKVKASIDEPGSEVVDALSLYRATSKFKPQTEDGLGTSDIKFSVSGKKKKLAISASTKYRSLSEVPHERNFPLLNKEFFPTFPPLQDKYKITSLPAGKLMDGIESIIYAVSADKGQRVFTGVLLELASTQMTIAASDGVCLAEHKSGIKYKGEECRFVLPGALASKLSRSFVDEDLDIYLHNNMFFVSSPNLIIGGPLIKEDYPDYKSVITQPDKYALLDKHVFLDNLLNISYEANDVPRNRVSVKLEEGSVSLVCGKSVNKGLITDFKGSFSFDCNLKLLCLSVKNIYGDKVRVGFSSPEDPLEFSSVEEDPNGSSLTCVLVPLSLD